MEILREQYLNQLIKKKHNGRIKIITGMRRCGKSYLLFNLFVKHLINNGVDDNHILRLALDELANARFRNPFELDSYIRQQLTDDKIHYILIDEIQFVEDVPNPYINSKSAKIGFTDVVLGLMKIKNVDVYITGSNSKMLSSDILTQFRDRGDEIRVFPLSYSEFYNAFKGDKRNAWDEYCTYGGLPYVMSLDTHEEKSKYLRELFEKTYMKDIIERNKIKGNLSALEDLINIVSSSVGSLTNPLKLSNTFLSVKNEKISSYKIEKYLDYFTDAFLLNKAMRYDVKGKRYIKTPFKYYFTDVGLRNARLNFRQQEENHIMENIIYCDLIRRGFDVDVGVVEYNTKNDNGVSMRKMLEIDFVVNRGSRRYYIQSALNVDTEEKKKQETESLRRVPDSFKKIVIVKDYINPRTDDNGIVYIGVEKFLLDEYNIF